MFWGMISAALGSDEKNISEKKNDFTIEFSKVSNKTTNCVATDNEGNWIGTFMFILNPEDETRVFYLASEINKAYRGKGWGPKIQRRCIDQLLKKRTDAEGVYTKVDPINYPSIKKNLAAGMTLKGIDDSGWFFFVDKPETKYLDDYLFKENVPSDYAKKVYEEFEKEYATDGDEMGGEFEISKKALAEKGIKNAKDLFNTIKKIAKENGITFEDFEKDKE